MQYCVNKSKMLVIQNHVDDFKPVIVIRLDLHHYKAEHESESRQS